MTDLKLERILKIRCFLHGQGCFKLCLWKTHKLFLNKRLGLFCFLSINSPKEGSLYQKAPQVGFLLLAWEMSFDGLCWNWIQTSHHCLSRLSSTLTSSNRLKCEQPETFMRVWQVIHTVFLRTVFTTSDLLNCWRCESAVEGKLPNNVKHQEN